MVLLGSIFSRARKGGAAASLVYIGILVQKHLCLPRRAFHWLYRPANRTRALWLGQRSAARGPAAPGGETKLEALRAALIDGEQGGPSSPFDFDDFLARKNTPRGE